MANGFRDYYADLGLQPGASTASVKAAFRALAIQHHPDKSGTADTTTFRQAREAFEQLNNVESRTVYDETYHYEKRRAHVDLAEEEAFAATRTEQYAAEEEVKRRPSSPPPRKPMRKPGEPSWSYFNGKAYTAWLERDDAWRKRHPEQCSYTSPPRSPYCSPPNATAHGLPVQMSGHPASGQRCSGNMQGWHLQTGGSDMCIFCLAMHTGGSRCRGCEALACPACLRDIVAKDRAAPGRSRWGSPSGFGYRAAGG